MKAKKNRSEWEIKFLNVAKLIHKKNLIKVVDKLLKKIDRRKNTLVSRSKKHGVICTITVDDMRQLVLDVYGKKCKYCDRIISTNNFVFDHIIPISKHGASIKENIQVICRCSNSIKGSLTEEHFLLFLDWIKTAPEELRKDLLIRLARGIH